MLIRVLSEWAGSPKCGAVADVPDALASERIRTGWAEAVTPPVAQAPIVVPETAEAQPRVESRPAHQHRKRRG